MFKKIALLAAFVAVAVSGQSVDTTYNGTNTLANASVVTNNTVHTDYTPYGAELWAKLLHELRIEHIPNNPLSDVEYNQVVNDLESLLTGEYKITHKNRGAIKTAIKQLLARTTPEEMEQLFDDVTFELTVKLFEKTFDEDDFSSLDESNSTGNATSSDIMVGAKSKEFGLASLNKEDLAYVGVGFGGCVLAVAVALAVIGARAQKKAQSTKSVLAEDVVDEIEAAENLAAEEKDAEVEDVKTDSPAVVSV